jgi:formylglycine-generating enzyme required for sulfatase activity
MDLQAVARQKLIAVVKRQGAGVVVDAKRCEGLLRDAFENQHHDELQVLLAALHDGTVVDMVKDTQTPSEHLVSLFAQRMYFRHKTQQERAWWGVETWALALGVIVKPSGQGPPAGLSSGPAAVAAGPAGAAAAHDPDDPFAATAALSPTEKLREAIRMMLEAGKGALDAESRLDLQILRESLGVSQQEASRIFAEEKARHAKDAAVCFHETPRAAPGGQSMPASVPAAPPATGAAGGRKVVWTFPPTQVGQVYMDGVGIQLAYIPAGTFVMGSPASEPGRGDDETQRKVMIDKAFAMGVMQVTQAQWRAVMATRPSHFVGDNLPVEQVLWSDAQSFCEKLTRMEGRRYRLPTEVEWEYACRAGTTSAFNWGTDSISDHQANYNASYIYNWSTRGMNRLRTTPVGSFQSNAWGLYDMHGNVWEWCADWYEVGRLRVMRGGSWGIAPRYLRSASRGSSEPGYMSRNFGLRVVVEI